MLQRLSILLLLLLVPLPRLASQPTRRAIEADDTPVTQSVRILPGVYHVEDAGDDGVLQVAGDDITLDLTGVTLIGAADGTPADEYRGRGIVARGSRRLTILGGEVRGFKVGLKLDGCDGLTLSGCDVSGNYRQHLRSTPQAEDGADWLFGHENDQDEWLRYGAGIHVEASVGITVSGCRARRGHNGLCLSRVSDSLVIDNDFSFLSGWGLAMWRSSRNEVSNNKLDWCMRGFSYNVYHRGQDSAGILVYEQCSDNVFAYNSATHGGDGFFLYAGNETLQRTGTGGCNRNLLYRNDFSHAAANGIEATFSDGNRFIENRLDECDHGVWGGYSYNTLIVGNSIRDCNNGISIEHGHGNRIERNAFERCGTGVHLRGGENPDFAKTAYGQKQDTASHAALLLGNTFRSTRVAVQLEATTDVTLLSNTIEATLALRADGRCAGVRADALQGKVEGKVEPPLESAATHPIPESSLAIPQTHGHQRAFLPEGALRGRRYIFVDDWGPYDFTEMRVFPRAIAAWGSIDVYLLGPDADFAISEVTPGVTVAPLAGRLPATLGVSASGKGLRPLSFLVTAGKETVRVEGLLLSADWDVRFYGWEDQGPQKPPGDWEAVLASPPLDTMRLGGIRFPWGGGRPSERVPADHFATVATTTLELPAGRYEFRTISDDGVRLAVDGQRVIDNWTWHPPHEDRAEVTLQAGPHALRLEHFEIDGYAQLELTLSPVAPR